MGTGKCLNHNVDVIAEVKRDEMIAEYERQIKEMAHDIAVDLADEGTAILNLVNPKLEVVYKPRTKPPTDA